MNKTQLPKNLFRSGFLRETYSNDETEIIDVKSLYKIVDFITWNFSKRKTINKRWSSYGLKHFVEEQIESYVSNGDFIAAMIICGFEYDNYEHSLNAFFNLSSKSYKKARNTAKINPPYWKDVI